MDDLQSLSLKAELTADALVISLVADDGQGDYIISETSLSLDALRRALAYQHPTARPKSL